MIKSIYINKRKADQKAINTLITALNDNDTIIKKGGFLFKSCYDGTDLHFGCTPWWFEGERQYHFNIPMRYSDEYTLIGCFLTGGTISILFKPQSEVLTNEQKEKYKINYVIYASFLINNGFDRQGKFDDISIELLKCAQIFLVPPLSAQEIARQY